MSDPSVSSGLFIELVAEDFSSQAEIVLTSRQQIRVGKVEMVVRGLTFVLICRVQAGKRQEPECSEGFSPAGRRHG